jgi:hypothetical protein
VVPLDVPDDRYREIADAIRSVDSPVGIDATRTHVMILHKLIEIERRLERLERSAHARDAEAAPPR